MDAIGLVGRRGWNGETEVRSSIYLGAQLQVQPKQEIYALHDGEPEAHAALALARGIGELHVLVEDAGELPGGNARPGVDDVHHEGLRLLAGAYLHVDGP